MTLICCGRDMPEELDEFVHDKTEIYQAFRQFATIRAAGFEIDFLLDVARERNVKAIYDTYIARADVPTNDGFDFGFDSAQMEALMERERIRKQERLERLRPQPKKKAGTGFFKFNSVFARRKKAKQAVAQPERAASTAAANVTPVVTCTTLNGQAFGRGGEIDEFLELGRANDFRESVWRPLLDTAYGNVLRFVNQNGIAEAFVKTPEFSAALRTVVSRLMRWNASSVLRALPMSGNGEPPSDDSQLVAALIETKMGVLLQAYNNPAANDHLASGEMYFKGLKATWGIEMEFWTFRNYLSRF